MRIGPAKVASISLALPPLISLWGCATPEAKQNPAGAPSQAATSPEKISKLPGR